MCKKKEIKMLIKKIKKVRAEIRKRDLYEKKETEIIIKRVKKEIKKIDL